MNISRFRWTTERIVAAWLCVLFGALYFVQGITEPTEGLISQPIRSLQSQWGWSTPQISTFAAIVAIPWLIKPAFGLLIDFVPLGRLGKRGYLMLSALVTASVCVALFWLRLDLQTSPWLLPLMVVCTAAVAISDVTVDAMMVQYGQPLGLTGRLQSVQWSCIYAASFIAGPLGGELCQQNMHALAFLIAGLLAACSFLLVLLWRPDSIVGIHANSGESIEPLIDIPPATSPLSPTYSLSLTLVFLLLWSFNPFSSAVQYAFMKDYLNFDDRFIGINASAFSAGALFASIAYGIYCRRVPFGRLLRISVVAGVLATLAYFGMIGRTSAIIVSICSGFTYMTGSMILLDLAARVCPPKVAGTVFSSLMAASNFSIQISTYLGGWIFGLLSETWSPGWIFRFLVLFGAITSGLCWLLVNRLSKTTGDQAAPAADRVGRQK